MADYPTVRRCVGHYDFCHPGEEQAAYRFQFPAGAPEATLSYTVPVGSEYDPGDSDYREALEACLEYARSCLWCGSLPKVEAAMKYIEDNELRFDCLQAKDEVAHAFARWKLKQGLLEGAIRRWEDYHDREESPAIISPFGGLRGMVEDVL